MNVQVRLPGTEHWTSKGDVKLFMWNKVAPLVRARGQAESMIRDCERDGACVSPLVQAIDEVFKAALRFYRKKHGKGPKARDISTFFKLKGLHSEFSSFWMRAATSRSRFRRAMKKFEERLRDEKE